MHQIARSRVPYNIIIHEKGVGIRSSEGLPLHLYFVQTDYNISNGILNRKKWHID